MKVWHDLKLTPHQAPGTNERRAEAYIYLRFNHLKIIMGLPNFYQPGCILNDPPPALESLEPALAYWSLVDQYGRSVFVWCYLWADPFRIKVWPALGDLDLLRELFGVHFETSDERLQRLGGVTPGEDLLETILN